MRTAYVAGPMRGYPQFNFPAFDAASTFLKARNWTVISPADLDRDANQTFGDDHHFTEQEMRDIALRDVTAIFTLRRSQGDAIVLLDGWELSTGARAEVALGRWLKLDFYVFRGTHLMAVHPRIEGSL